MDLNVANDLLLAEILVLSNEGHLGNWENFSRDEKERPVAVLIFLA